MILLRVAGLLLALGSCGCAADALRRSVRPGAPPDTSLMLFLLFFTGIQSLMILAVGFAGLLSPLPLVCLSAGGLILLAAFRQLPSRPAFPWKRPVTAWEWTVTLLGAALAVSLLLKVIVLGPYWYDAVTYHLPNVAEWVRSGRIVCGFSPESRTWFPMGLELSEAWWVVFLGRDTLVETAGLQMFGIALASVHVLARVHGFRPGLAVLIYAFVPVLLLHVTACGSDLPAAAMILAAFALIAEGAPLALQALPLLLGAGMKPTVLFGAVGVAMYGLLTARRERLDWRLATSLLVGGLALGSAWYVRNWVVKGHPLYPVYGEATLSALQAGPLDSYETLQRTVQEFPGRAVDPRPYSALSADATSWGWFVLPWAAPLTLLALRADAGYRKLALCFAVGASTTIALSPLNQLNLRFVLWFPALFALGAARAPSRWVPAAAVLAAILNFIPTLVPPEARLPEKYRLPPSLPRTEPVACIFTNEVPAYPYYNPDYSRRVIYPTSMEEVKSSGVRYVVVWGIPTWAEPMTRWRRVGGKVYEVPP